MSLTISAQIISIISMVVMKCFSFQMKRNKNLFAMQISKHWVCCQLLYAWISDRCDVQYRDCLGACSSLFLNSKNNYWVLFILELYFIVVTFFTYGGLMSFFSFIAQLSKYLFMWKR